MKIKKQTKKQELEIERVRIQVWRFAFFTVIVFTLAVLGWKILDITGNNLNNNDWTDRDQEAYDFGVSNCLIQVGNHVTNSLNLEGEVGFVLNNDTAIVLVPKVGE